MLTVEKCVSELQRRGYTFSMKQAVSVKQPKKYDPKAAAMMEFLALNRDEVRQYVRGLQWEQEQLMGGTYRLTGLPADEGLALAQAIERGETLMIHDAVYHESTGLFDIAFVPLERTSEQLG